MVANGRLKIREIFWLVWLIYVLAKTLVTREDWRTLTPGRLPHTAMISVKKKTSEVHVINKKTCARPGKKEAELHEFLEQYLRIFRAISTSNPTYSVYMGSIFKHYMEHILSILELWFEILYDYALYEPFSKKSWNQCDKSPKWFGNGSWMGRVS